MAEVAGELEHLGPRVAGRDRLEPMERAVAAAVVDIDDLEVHPGGGQRRDEPGVGRLDHGLFVVAGDDDREQPAGGPRRGWLVVVAGRMAHRVVLPASAVRASPDFFVPTSRKSCF